MEETITIELTKEEAGLIDVALARVPISGTVETIDNVMGVVQRIQDLRSKLADQANKLEPKE